MGTLVTAFDGPRNSSRLLLATLCADCEKLLLPNSRDESANRLTVALESHLFSHVVLLGQKPALRDKVSVETQARAGAVTLSTGMDCQALCTRLSTDGYSARISQGAGTSYCNHIYAVCLEWLGTHGHPANAVFLHVPYLGRMTLGDLCPVLDKLILSLDREGAQ